MVPNPPLSPSRRAVLGTSAILVSGGVVGSVLSASADAQSSSSFEDWPLERYDPAGTGYNPDTTGPGETVREKWRVEFDGVHGGSTSPILVDGTLYVVGGGGVAALDADDGTVQYHRVVPAQSSPALSAATAYTSKTLVVAGSQGYVGYSANGGTTLFGHTVGFRRWFESGEKPETLWFGGRPTASSPVTADGTVYVADAARDRLTALDPSNGREYWAQTVGRDKASGEPGRPAVRDGVVYTTWWPEGAEAYDAETGERLWRQRVTESVVLPPVATVAGVVVPDRSGATLLALDDGAEQWRFDHGGNVTEGTTAVAEETVFLTDDTKEQHLYAIDLETGEERWKTRDIARETTPVVADGVVYVASSLTEELVAVDAETGEVYWRREMTNPSTPAISDGTLFVVGYDHVSALEAGR